MVTFAIVAANYLATDGLLRNDSWYSLRQTGIVSSKLRDRGRAASAINAECLNTPGIDHNGGHMRHLYGSLKILSFTVLLLMLGAIGYAFFISLVYWGEIGV